MDWLHFIGKGFYPTSEIFETEAVEFGVSRRINKLLLQKFNFGDRVFLFQKEKKGSILFGYFIIDSVLAEFPEEFYIQITKEKKVVEKTVIKVFRKCGSFILVIKRKVKYSIKDIDQKIKIYGCEYLMIGGTFFSLPKIKTPIVFQQGFRMFNYEELKRQKNESIKLDGQYYLSQIQKVAENKEGSIIQISDYIKNPAVRAARKKKPGATKIVVSV